MRLMKHLRNFIITPTQRKINAQKKQTAQFTVCFLSDRKSVYFFIT